MRIKETSFDSITVDRLVMRLALILDQMPNFQNSFIIAKLVLEIEESLGVYLSNDEVEQAKSCSSWVETKALARQFVDELVLIK